MKTYALVVQYDGTEYAGFQVQVGQRTIQGNWKRPWLNWAPTASGWWEPAEQTPVCTAKGRR